MNEFVEKPQMRFYHYPSVGEDDWRYGFATAEVRALETTMLTKPVLLDMIGAEDFDQAADLLSSTEYSLSQSGKGIAEMENVLRARRSEVRELFADLIVDDEIVEIFKARQDFSNLRLAIRREVTEKEIGTDYSEEGTISPGELRDAFEQEDFYALPEYMKEAIEKAVLMYYEDKDIRQIDFGVDYAQADYNLAKAQELGSVFLTELFRMEIDLNNIRTMFRLKLAGSERRDVFIAGGYLEHSVLRQAMASEYDGIVAMFANSAYSDLFDLSVNYIAAQGSFLRLEERCEDHVIAFLKSTSQITAGPQPVVAYLLMKENEIRTVRLILTAKSVKLDKRLILDRLGHE